MNARVTCSARSASHLAARRFLSGRSAAATLPIPSPSRGGGAASSHLLHLSHRRRPSGRATWQWQTVRAALNVAVRPDTYREELDVKIELARAHFAPSLPAPSTHEAEAEVNLAAASAVAAASSSPGGGDGGGGGGGGVGIPLPHTEVFESPKKSHFRMRAEFRVWHEVGRCRLTQ
jgi:tRNA (uracil-5-)-methyltransferase